ncbi:FmdB family zinc ribbon protein [Wenzhouxiangella sp. EGI_FJ10409]|uniref:FmdB family zinc ribbon protein n=1 Tax=Wenzhouxiangella sp. EGI_FJ10409 TaxID=3243767 RepID=UPI0035DCF68F
MPFYEYISTEPQAGCDYCSQPVTILQKMDDPLMRKCPYCGHPVRRLISPPNLAGQNSRAPTAGEAEKAGFTQYRKIGKGVYEKSAGKGPDIISSD